MATDTKKLTWKEANLSYDQAIRIAWERGLLTYKLLKHQVSLFKIVAKKGKKITTINCSRRYGKTTVLLIYAFIFCQQNADCEVKFISPTQKSLRKSIFPIIRKVILKDCPQDIKPKWSSQDGCYYFKNGAKMDIYGTDQQQHDSLRGQSCELGIIDEAAYTHNCLKYVVTDILIPQAMLCDGRIVISSTPNKKTCQSGEEFQEFTSLAELDDAYYTKTVYDNSSLSKRLIEEHCKYSGGEESATWKTEYLCQFVIDEEKALCPEWDTNKYVVDIPQPKLYSFFHKYESLDLGFKRDFTVLLYAYYDFLEAKLVVLDEWRAKNMVSTEIVSAMRDMESTYAPNMSIYRRVSDNDNLMLLKDLSTLHNLPIIPTKKTVLESMVNNLRSWVQDGRILVHPRCKMLIQTMEKGCWADSVLGNQRKDFSRTDSLGHMDSFASLMYLCKNIDVHTNPIPRNLGVDFYNAHSPKSAGNYDGPQKGLAGLFNKKYKKK